MIPEKRKVGLGELEKEKTVWGDIKMCWQSLSPFANGCWQGVANVWKFYHL